MKLAFRKLTFQKKKIFLMFNFVSGTLSQVQERCLGLLGRGELEVVEEPISFRGETLDDLIQVYFSLHLSLNVQTFCSRQKFLHSKWDPNT